LSVNAISPYQNSFDFGLRANHTPFDHVFRFEKNVSKNEVLEPKVLFVCTHP
jgi:endonuclease/exonuclease/phosphatase (EEP) superfamily protein YafD